MVLKEPRIVDGKPMTFAGMEKALTYQETHRISAIWNEFGPRIGSVPGEIGGVAYGISHKMNERDFLYLACVEVASVDGLPSDLQVLEIPAQRYAVFPHEGHVSTLSQTCQAIGGWIQRSGNQAVDDPVMIERYGPGFDPQTGLGDMEVWYPIR